MRTHLKSIAGFLIVFIIFQSCVSAKSVTVDQAVLKEQPVRIKTVEGETYNYKKLIRRDSILYGVKKVKGVVGLVELDLSQLNISEVKYASPAATAVLVVVSVIGLLSIIGLADCFSSGGGLGCPSFTQ
ncbi:MAG: hypothetical protein IIB82_00395 [Bacteroidetes bacterium]|nr:hypothetical protein [Bacteroidota bacterium]